MNERIKHKRWKRNINKVRIILAPPVTWNTETPQWKRRKLIQRSYERYGISMGFHACPHTLEDRNIRRGKI